MTTAPAAKKKAFSYLRFSTPEQAQGDSFRRQTSMALAYANAHGLELDESITFHDLGVSGFRGANLDTGQLGAFREAVRAGLIPAGSVLLMEALDRLTRMDPWDAVGILRDIMREGITVVTVNDGRVYDQESMRGDPTSLLIAVVLFMRGNEESATKARRLKAAWAGKRLTAATKPLTASVPAWIKMEREGDGAALALIPERAGIVRRIFAETLAGYGQHAIAQGLTADGVPCFGRATHWHRTYIGKILSNPATHGVFIPHEYRMAGPKRVRSPLVAVEGYYPPVILPETFREVQRLRGTAHKTKARTGQIVSLFAGLATCPHCGFTMTRVNKGTGPKGGRPKLVCTKAKAGAGCQYHGVDLGTVEVGLLSHLGGFIGNAPSGVEGLDAELAKLDTSIGVYQDEADNLVRALSAGPSPTVSKKLRELEQGLGQEQAARVGVLEKISTGSSPVLAQRLRDLEWALSAEPLDRPKANALMRSVLSSVVVDYPSGQLIFAWKHGGESTIQYAWPAH